MFMRDVHPSAVLNDELAEIRITPAILARELDVPPNRSSQIIVGKRSIMGDTALRLGHWFGTGPEFWLNLQTQYDFSVVIRKIGRDIQKLPIWARQPASELE